MKLKTMPHHTHRNANRTFTAGLHDEKNLMIGAVTASTEERANKLAAQIALEHNTHPALLAACEYVVKWHREHDSGSGELFGLDFVTTCIAAIRQAKGE